MKLVEKFLYVFFCTVCLEVNSMELRVEAPSRLFAASLLKVRENPKIMPSLQKTLRQKISDSWEKAQSNTLDNSDFFSYTYYSDLQDLLMMLNHLPQEDKNTILEKARQLGNEIYKAVLTFMEESQPSVSCTDEDW